MNISLTPELDGFVKSLVESGNYFSASEVVRDGLRLLKDQQALREIKLGELRATIQEGKTAIAEGRYTDIKNAEELDDFMEDVKKSASAKVKGKENSQYDKYPTTL